MNDDDLVYWINNLDSAQKRAWLRQIFTDGCDGHCALYECVCPEGGWRKYIANSINAILNEDDLREDPLPALQILADSLDE